MKYLTTNPEEASKLGTKILSLFIVGLLIVLNLRINFSVPAISNDDPDSSSGQSNFASNSNKNLTCFNPWEPAIFSTPATGNNDIIPLSEVCDEVWGLRIDRDSVLSIKLRGPPLGVGFFG